jgi:hypothetical protein
MVRCEFKFRVSDDVVIWVHNVDSERFYDFCMFLPVCFDCSFLLYRVAVLR